MKLTGLIAGPAQCARSGFFITLVSQHPGFGQWVKSWPMVMWAHEQIQDAVTRSGRWWRR